MKARGFVVLSALMLIGAGVVNDAQAAANAFNWANGAFRFVFAQTQPQPCNPINCRDVDCAFLNLIWCKGPAPAPAVITATSVSPLPPNLAIASASAGPGGQVRAVVFVRGLGAGGIPSRGFEATAIGDTTVLDSFQVSITPINATSASMVLNGEALLQRNVAAPGVGRLDLLVYPDTTTANLDPTRTGAGAVFVGRLMVDRDGIEKATGGWSAGDFQVQVTADRARVRAVNLTKTINCPNSGNLATSLEADASAVAVPSHTPFMVTILSLLMAGAGWIGIRRMKTTV